MYVLFHVRANAGFDAEKVVTFELPLPATKYADTERMAQLYQQVLLRLESVPVVRSVGFASVVPMGGAADGTVIRIPQHPAANRSEQPYSITPSFPRDTYRHRCGATSRARLERCGYAHFTARHDHQPCHGQQVFPGRGPDWQAGRRGSTEFPVRTIVGVIGDIKHASLREVPEPEMLVPFTQNEINVWPSMQTMQFVVRTKIDDALIEEHSSGCPRCRS